jgi:hypothetical protein
LKRKVGEAGAESVKDIEDLFAEETARDRWFTAEGFQVTKLDLSRKEGEKRLQVSFTFKNLAALFETRFFHDQAFELYEGEKPGTAELRFTVGGEGRNPKAGIEDLPEGLRPAYADVIRTTFHALAVRLKVTVPGKVLSTTAETAGPGSVEHGFDGSRVETLDDAEALLLPKSVVFASDLVKIPLLPRSEMKPAAESAPATRRSGN